MKIRAAKSEDLAIIVNMLADDKLGKTREKQESSMSDNYINAFKNIKEDKNQELIVVEDEEEIIGTLQLSFIQYLTYEGGIRSQIEAVRIRKDKRGKGIGKYMIEWAIQRAKERNAHLVQLTTDKRRPQSIAFYENLGFRSTHEGMKLHF